MPDAATTAAPATTAPAATTEVPSAGGTLLTPQPAEWANNFQNNDIKTYVSQKGFKSAEALAESYKALETKFSSRAPDDRTIVIPEKFEGDAAKAVFEKLGMPKEAKDYGFIKDEKTTDIKFTEWAESAFHKSNLTKSQADSLLNSYNEKVKADIQASIDSRKNAISQAEAKLKAEWGAQYDQNVNLAKQGAKILGLDQKTLDIMEAMQGRDSLFKNLQKIGVAVGESNFVDGKTAAPATMTEQEAQAELKKLINDKEFSKKVNAGDRQALEEWNRINQLAAPGTKPIG